ncbi:acyltransferase [Microbacterium foliorum]|uniref:O-acetyltransferase OatA n=1 Tax=Microbacterium foliorum TaxID=104336 RepID=A0A0F0KFQ0_9MICO|nr:acyltransferase family protein [Microbacterium foliorum]AXL11751.1 acyltransferase [Microbacterium foliorum]KJL18121.1 O-acetyltransferase OatA [Microbacterium foliorum]
MRPETTSAAPSRRADIDGLRTLAIVLVVVYHVWLGRVSGGVDVFLMVSAFLLTGSLARRAITGAPLALGAFWTRRFRRLVPAAAVTLLAVLGAAYAFMPPSQWSRIWNESLASLFYVQNWQLAFSEVDYYARDSAETSPLQHFWSLSVQGQVFLLWPLLIGAVALLLRRRRDLIRPVLVAVFLVIFVWSLWFSVIETRDAQAFAYFDTRTRLWEFAAGSLLALLQPLIRMPAPARAVLGWAGLAGIVLCGIVLDVRGGFPGYLALWPVLCTAAVIIAGAGEQRGGPAALLGSRPLSSLSSDAYALYLVHWPILVMWMVVAETDRVGLVEGAIIIGMSLVAARLLSRGVERPLRGPSRTDRPAVIRGVAVIAASVVVVTGATAGWRWVEQTRTAEFAAAAADSDYPGASQVEAAFEIADLDTPMIPSPTELQAEWAAVGPACTGRFAPRDAVLDGTCNQSDDAADAAMRILVIGDSHAQQLSAPLIALSEDRDLAIITVLRGGCTAGLAEESRSPTEASCEPWARAALDYAKAISPDAVYLVVTRADAQEPERLLHGIEEAVGELRAADIPVIGVRDNPRFDFDMYECAIDESRGCEVPRELVLAEENPTSVFADAVTTVDFTPWLCPWDVCQAAIGNIAVYIDDNHLSRSYARTLSPFLERILADSGHLPPPSA